MKLVTVEEMRAIETEANRRGLSYAEMMQRAGRGVAETILNLNADKNNPSVVGLVGPGNNGGDTLVALAVLAEAGWRATAYMVKARPDDDILVAALRAAGGSLFLLEEDASFKKLKSAIGLAQVLIDGLFGTGVQLPLRQSIIRLLNAVHSEMGQVMVVAVDCPSGVDCDSGEAAPETLPADVTVCLAAVKVGLVKFPAFGMCGGIVTVDLGFPADLPTWEKIDRYILTENEVCGLLPARPLGAHKGTFGTALLVVGSVNYTGAALLAGEAAYRTGVGLVQMAVPTPLHGPLAAALPEATWLLLPDEVGVISANAAQVLWRNLERATTVLLGCGWGQEDTTAEFLHRLLSMSTAAPAEYSIGFLHQPSGKEIKTMKLPPLVIDADALRLLANMEDWVQLLPPGSILTPHPGEMAALTGLSVDDIQANRLEVAKKYALQWNQIVVLKGAITIVALPSGAVHAIPFATAALARAGTGDVLAGMITSLRAQGLDAAPAALAGTWLHGSAGLIAENIIGHNASVLARDVIAAIAPAMASIRS